MPPGNLTAKDILAVISIIKDIGMSWKWPKKHWYKLRFHCRKFRNGKLYLVNVSGTYLIVSTKRRKMWWIVNQATMIDLGLWPFRVWLATDISSFYEPFQLGGRVLKLTSFTEGNHIWIRGERPSCY